VFDRLRAWLDGTFGEPTETRDAGDDRDAGGGRRGPRRPETAGEDRNDSRFVPSPLDRSVRRAHGSGDREADRELGRIGERARELTEADRRD
jgi:hypothetical protein